MPCPNYAQKLFVEAWSGQPNPTDVPLEQKIVASMHGSADCMGMASGYLVAADFTDETAKASFTQLARTFRDVGGKTVPVSGLFGESLKELRRVHGQRIARTLGWKLAYNAHTMTPEGWCHWAAEELEKLAKRMRKSGLEAKSTEVT
jgi:hypothetical protein